MKTECTVLVVDDEESVLRVTSRMCRSLKCCVITASSGEEAVNVFMANAGIDIVLCDLILPGIGGVETVENIRRLNPTIKVIMTSGCSELDVPFGFDAFLSKPYGLEELRKIMKDVVG